MTVQHNVIPLPLSTQSAKRLINYLACHQSDRIYLSKHAKERMKERDVTTVQLFNLLKNKHLHFHVNPFQAEKGDWVCNIEGSASGENIRATLAFKQLENDPSILVVTVMSLR